jgi:putative transposase
MLAERKQYYKDHKNDESRTHKYKTEKDYKEEFEWLKQMDSYALCNEYMNLQIAFNNFFRSPKVGFPKFKSKKRDKSSYTTSNVNGVIKILDDRHIKLPKIKSLRIKLHRQLPENSRIKSATIERKPSGKYYISLCVEYESQVTNIELDKNKVIGLDYSSHDFYVDSNGNKTNYPKYYRLYQDKLAKE